MKCEKCGKEIDELEKYCDDCKNENELDKLIVENKELNKHEITKELETLQNFKEEKKENTLELKEKLKNIVNIEEEEEFKLNDNKKTIIILSIVGTLIIALVIICLLIFVKPKEKVEIKEEINYENVLNEYGDLVKNVVDVYLKQSEDIPSWSIISDLVEYSKHDVVCNVHEIYKDGKIYLSDCKINKKSTDYSYGEKQEIIGKEISIYKYDSEKEYFDYTDEEKGELVGNITCLTENCEYVTAYDKYVLISENNKYYLYDYEKKELEFGPFNITDDNYENNLLVYGNTLYGLMYNDNEQTNIYSIKQEKILKNIEGNLLDSQVKYNPRLMYKYGYAVFENEDKYNFINLNTGNVSYSITGILNSFIEDTTKKLVYITTYNQSNSKITIYNSNGKKLFNGKEYNDIKLLNGNLLVSNDTNFYIYDSNLKLTMASKTYTRILGVYEDYVVVVNENLELVDLEDNVLATYDLKWEDTYTFNSMLSGKFKEKDKDIIYLVIEDNDETLKYYYIPSTKEFGLK